MNELRFAILSDIHGNSVALDAVLADIKTQGGVDEYWILGDLVALGHDPIGVLERLSALPVAHYIRGNTDRYVLTGELPAPPLAVIKNNLPRIEHRFRLARGFSWTLGAVAAAGWLPRLEHLPLEKRVKLPDGTSVLLVHAAPGTDDGDGIQPDIADNELRDLVSGMGADLLMVGHTHAPFERLIDDIRVVNPGSVSNSFPPDLRASYALCTCDQNGCVIEHRRVDYDRQAVIEALERLRHPSVVFLTRIMRGENKPG